MRTTSLNRALSLAFGIALLALFSALPGSAYAVFENGSTDFVPLAGIPFMNGGSYTMPQLINALYRISIVVGALVAVLKITLAGIKYMGTDSIGTKSEAKEDIKNSLLGLLILLAAVLILKQIIGDIKLDILQLNSRGGTSAPSVMPALGTPPT